MTNFSISECYSDSWELLKRNLLLILFYLITIVPSLIVEEGGQALWMPGLAHNPDPMDLLDDGFLFPLIGLGFLSSVIQSFLTAGFYKATLDTVKGGKAEFSAFNLPVGTYLKFVCAMMCVLLLTYAGFLCCIIPGIIVIVRLLFVPLIIIDDPECGFFDAFQRSWDITRGCFWSLFGLGIMNILVIIGGFFCCCIGILVAMPFVSLVYADVYHVLKEKL